MDEREIAETEQYAEYVCNDVDWITTKVIKTKYDFVITKKYKMTKQTQFIRKQQTFNNCIEHKDSKSYIRTWKTSVLYQNKIRDMLESKGCQKNHYSHQCWKIVKVYHENFTSSVVN